eukprot:501924-Pyramimonas_sp.AAC.1
MKNLACATGSLAIISSILCAVGIVGFSSRREMEYLSVAPSSSSPGRGGGLTTAECVEGGCGDAREG